MAKFSINRRQALYVVNSITIFVSLCRILSFIGTFWDDFFAWWLPMGKIFSYIHFYHFLTFFIIPVPFGIYFMALVLSLISGFVLLLYILRRSPDNRIALIALLMLCGALGSSVTLIGE